MSAPAATGFDRPSTSLEGRSVRVRGTVQGVGFRPFVYSLAQRHGLSGLVRNTGTQVEIEIEGPPAALDGFLADLQAKAPPLAAIERIDVTTRSLSGYQHFRIVPSELSGGHQPVAPDIATCDDCLRELFDPADRRYRYPFINCTNCGPRFTIIEALPYDRARTTMRHFQMCASCRREYEDPADRRFHAQPIACPVCGPRVWLHGLEGCAESSGGHDPFVAAARLLRSGHILAVKGLGGFQLACDATSEAAVSRLRQRKRRYGKPFALMVPDLHWAVRLAVVNPTAMTLLQSRERPIVLVERLPDALLAPDIAAGLSTIGLMLPYTPLHHLLLREMAGPLVLTSGNLSEEPIAIGNEEALDRLAQVADAFLLHDREICARYDDSVIRVTGAAAVPIRRARSFAPAPIALPFRATQDILAFGAQQKNTFCLVHESNAYLSQHIGELNNVLTGDHLRDTLALYLKLFRAEPRLIAHDAHPDYLSTRCALEYAGGIPRVAVQHHHAHVVSCMAEHQLEGPVIGVAYDGTGLGSDGAIWGGEVLTATWRGYERRAHVRYVPLLGGEAAVHEPLRMLVSHLWAADLMAEHTCARLFERLSSEQRTIWRQQFESGLNAPPTSSCGRLFDAAAVLLGVCEGASYEGEPAARLEAIADPHAEGVYPYEVVHTNGRLVVNPGPTLLAMWHALERGDPVPAIAMRFHHTVASFTARVCGLVHGVTGITQVCLSGGCFQNALLLEHTRAGLEKRGFQVFTHNVVPPNDGGIALGQAIVAAGRSGIQQ
jgi:hydrogenase maturation protein HypF